MNIRSFFKYLQFLSILTLLKTIRIPFRNAKDYLANFDKTANLPLYVITKFIESRVEMIS
jgi:hypothetical protein